MQVLEWQKVPVAKMLPATRLRRPVTLRPVLPTQAGELVLRRLLTAHVAALGSVAQQRIIEALRRDRRARGVMDAPATEVERAVRELEAVAQAAIDRVIAEAEAEIAAEGQRHTQRFNTSVAAGLDLDIGAQIAASDAADLLATRAAVFGQLVRNVSADVQGRIARAALDGVYGGTTDDVARAIRDATQYGMRRARLIARDQMGSLNSDLNEFRQRQIGVTQYEWKTIIDGRERHSHHERNGRIFSWDNPPPDGPPGRAINCRCRALAIVTLPGEELRVGN